MPTGRTAYAAVHVVADPWRTPSGNGRCHWDAEATLSFRHHVWDQGLGVAEAMDTAQRGMGLAWEQAKELIALTLEAARDREGADVVVGVRTDQLDSEETHSLGRIAEAYLEQLEFVESRGAGRGHAILDPTVPLARHLFAAPTQYYKVGVVFLAWLNGHQSHFHIIGGLQGQCSLGHLVTLAGLAAGCGALTAPELAQERLDALFRVAGVA